MDSITLVLPYPISTNRYWRSFVPKGRKRAITVLSEEAEQYKKSVANIAAFAGIKNPICGRVGVQYTLVPKRPQDWARRQKKDPEGWTDSVQCIDLDNAMKVLMDSLNGIAFEDDKWVRTIEASRGEPAQDACVYVRVYKINKTQQQKMEI